MYSTCSMFHSGTCLLYEYSLVYSYELLTRTRTTAKSELVRLLVHTVKGVTVQSDDSKCPTYLYLPPCMYKYQYQRALFTLLVGAWFEVSSSIAVLSFSGRSE